MPITALSFVAVVREEEEEDELKETAGIVVLGISVFVLICFLERVLFLPARDIPAYAIGTSLSRFSRLIISSTFSKNASSA